MLQRGLPGALALAGLLAGSVAHADHYRSGPQVRLGIDVNWGGYGSGYYPAPPPVAVYLPHYEPIPVYGYGRARWRGNGHRRHRHHAHCGHDHDD